MKNVSEKLAGDKLWLRSGASPRKTPRIMPLEGRRVRGRRKGEAQVLNFSAFLFLSRVAFNCRVEKVKSLRKSDLGSLLLVTECRVESLEIAVLDREVSSRNRTRICVRQRAKEKQFERRKRDAASFGLSTAAVSIPALHSPLTAPK